MNLQIRYQKISDAKDFYEILKYPHLKYFYLRPKSLKEMVSKLKKNSKKKKHNCQHNFAIIYDSIIVGGIGLKIDQHRDHVAEIGYFIGKEYQGKGIATNAIRLFIKMLPELKLGIKRLEIIVRPTNKPSINVAEKAHFKKEGLLRKKIYREQKYYDAYLFGRIL
ncbi:MAG: GNAT family N-acetyltransferase [Candidatus Woesearchaeota archaeon]